MVKKMTKEQVWAKYRLENTKLVRVRKRQAKVKKIVGRLWKLLRETSEDAGKVGEDNKS